MVLLKHSNCECQCGVPVIDPLNVAAGALEAGVVEMEDSILVLRTVTLNVEDVVFGQGQRASRLLGNSRSIEVVPPEQTSRSRFMTTAACARSMLPVPLKVPLLSTPESMPML